MATKVMPLLDRVLIRRGSSEVVSAGGIILPENVQKRPLDVEVLAVGPGRMLDSGDFRPTTVKVGDHALAGIEAGTPITVDGEELFVLKEEELLAVVRTVEESAAVETAEAVLAESMALCVAAPYTMRLAPDSRIIRIQGELPLALGVAHEGAMLTKEDGTVEAGIRIHMYWNLDTLPVDQQADIKAALRAAQVASKEAVEPK
jgi:chaperonin GroES